MRDGDVGCCLLVVVAELYGVSGVEDGCRSAMGWKAYLNRHVGVILGRLGLHIGDDIGPVTSIHEADGSPPIVAVVGADGAVSEGGEEASAPS